jgi:hypothetical protein
MMICTPSSRSVVTLVDEGSTLICERSVKIVTASVLQAARYSIVPREIAHLRCLLLH